MGRIRLVRDDSPLHKQIRASDPLAVAKGAESRAVTVEPTAGLEPATYGLRSGPGPNPAEPEESQPFVLHGSGRLVSRKEPAERLGIKRSTVYTLCANGELPHVRVGSLLRVDLDAFLATHRQTQRDRRRL